MTRIRRINVSQVEGGNANDTDTDFRPFGETAFYLDTDPATDKLVLMMFDGIRTNLKSKVLTPGILFGSNADSGDGAGFDTIKLIPDATLHRAGGAYDNDQYLIVDPTAPNHIHLRAGGVQDNSSAQMFIGGETSYFSVGSGLNPPLFVTANSNVWTFGTDGILTFPNGGGVFSADQTTIFGAVGQNTALGQHDGNTQIYTQQSGVGIQAHYAGMFYTWTFNNTGNIELPGGGTISAADYDIDIVAGNNGVGTFGSVTINTQAPPVTYPVVQQTSPQGTDVITTNIIETPYIASIVPGMPVIGSGITVPTTVDFVTGPDIYGTYTINLTPAIGQQLPYLETYTIGGAGVSNNVWEFNSQGSIGLPHGGVINNDANSSGDGNGYSTMSLIPDSNLEGNDQYIILDPTAPGHIHIRAGGTQDSSGASLILGGENSNFTVYNGTNPSVSVSANNNTWTFGTDGNLTFPGGGIIDGSDFDVDIIAGNDGANTYGHISFTANGPNGFNSLTFNSLGEINVSTAGANDGLVKWVGNSSGDGNGFTTMVLVPDTTVEGNDQYIILDPTAPGHIHIRAGGMQDGSSADLILGGENSHFKVPAGSNTSVSVSANNNTWTFDTNGTLVTPSNLSIGSNPYVPGSFIDQPDSSFSITSSGTGTLAVGWSEQILGPGGVAFVGFNDSAGNISLVTGNLATTTNTWSFNYSGGINFPDSTVQSTAFTANPTLDVLRIEDGVHERFQPLADATGVVTHDCSLGHIFYHTSPDADWTANFINLNLSNTYATSVTLVIAQGGTGYYPSNVQIEGAAQTISWQGNTTPTTSTNRTDVVNFSILNSSNSYIVLGQLTGF